MTGLSAAQHTQLLAAINPRRVGHKDGQSHLEAYDVRAHLNRLFGFGGWSGDVLDMSLMYEGPCEIGQDKRSGYEVGYSCTYRLTIHATGATYTETAFGGQKMGVKSRGDCHDFAIKTAESQALKRAAINLGDQFGLGLYAKGSLGALVGRTLVAPKEDLDPFTPKPPGEHADVTEHITEQLAPEDSPAEPAEPEGAPAAPARQADDPVDEVRAEALAATKKADLMRLLMRCGKEQIGGAMTTDGDGKGLTLETLINARLKALAA